MTATVTRIAGTPVRSATHAPTSRRVTIRRDPSELGRRRRARLTRTVVALAVVIAVALWGPTLGATSSEEPGAVDTYTVSSGETMWSIASAISEPGEDVWALVDQIAHLNGLQPSQLQAGQQIIVPVA